MKLLSIYLIVFLSGCVSSHSHEPENYQEKIKAALQLPSFFSDNMVLQQKSEVKIWGTDNPNTLISVKASWGQVAQVTSDSKGDWNVSIATPSASRDQQLVISGSSKKTINNINLGEVWLCSGQSNMEMPVKGLKNQPIAGSLEAILNSTNNEISLFQVEKKASLIPLTDVNGNWQKAAPESVSNFSAACYFFGKKLHDVVNVPIGLIATSWGASSAEAWTPKTSLQKLKDVPLATEISKKRPQQTATALYNGMLHPFIGYKVKGFVWYQGESNRTRAEQYKTRFSAMISSWRDAWQDSTLPFYFTQIAPYSYNKKTNTANVNSAYLREAQLYTMANVENTGMAVTLDIGDCDRIHPKDKREVGERLAYWALAKDYNVPAISFSGPVYDSMTVKGNKVEINFSHAELGLDSMAKHIPGFEVAGQDKVFHPANSKIKRGPIQVWSELVDKPVAVRYAFTNCPDASLFGTNGLPASSFRTDNW